MQVREAQIPRELNSGTITKLMQACSCQCLQWKNVVQVEQQLLREDVENRKRREEEGRIHPRRSPKQTGAS